LFIIYLTKIINYTPENFMISDLGIFMGSVCGMLKSGSPVRMYGLSFSTSSARQLFRSVDCRHAFSDVFISSCPVGKVRYL
jgi:hypothetical protein